MPYSNIQPDKLVSKLFLRDQNNFYENRQMGLLLAASPTKVYPIGTLLSRAKGTAGAAWKVAVAEDLVVANEFAVLGGNHESIWLDVNHVLNATNTNIVYFSDRLTLDETEFFLINTVFNTTALKEAVISLLTLQQIVFCKRAPAYTPI